jgi:dTDP-4-amino-4,6-dideoxygalactose transaminase
MGMIAAGVGRDDEVLTVPMTFIATAWGVSYQGATPAFVDVDRETYTMDVRQVEKRLTRRVKALLPVHLYGLAANMGPLMDLSKKHGIPVVEDCAQAHGATYHGQSVGTFGVCGCFSFYPGKNLGAYGEGGAVVTNDDEVAGRLRRLRDHGQAQRYHHDEVGFNYRMDAMQGAILGIKLARLAGWTESRRRLARRYQEELAGLPIRLPVEPPERRHVWHLFVVLHERRDEIRKGLEERGVQTGLHYPIPVHLQKAYAHLGYGRGEFPVAERVARECLTLPLFSEMTERQQDAVIEAIEDVLAEVGQ